jgi:LmbE family N-acetylglucosaminyl deacetylase
MQRKSDQEMDNRLAVYIGAHPDDIDVGMSGSLYKFDLGKHPIMWVVVTDGGTDADEYNFDSSHYNSDLSKRG